MKSKLFQRLTFPAKVALAGFMTALPAIIEHWHTHAIAGETFDQYLLRIKSEHDSKTAAQMRRKKGDN